MDTIKAANKIIKDGVALLPDEAKADYRAQTGDIFTYEAISNAMAMVNGDLERSTLLEAYAVQEANRVVTTLWREQLLTPELEEEYRKLPSMKEESDAYNMFITNRKARLDKVMEEHRAIANEEKELDIFKGVINGMDKKESEKKYAEYQQQQQQAMAGGR